MIISQQENPAQKSIKLPSRAVIGNLHRLPHIDIDVDVPGFGDIPVFIVAVDNEVFIPRAIYSVCCRSSSSATESSPNKGSNSEPLKYSSIRFR